MSKKVYPPRRAPLEICILEPGRKAIQACPKDALVVEIDNHIKFKLDVLDTYYYEGWKPLHYDLLVLSAAIEFADCRRGRGIREWSRHFSLTVPVFELETWQQKAVQQSLSAALNHLTGDDWQFHFIQWQGNAVGSKRQQCLPFGRNKQFAIAYSDGLDSRCVSSLLDQGDEAVRVRLAKNRDKLKKGDQPFDQIPFSVKVRSTESSVRSRGFKFAAVTAIASQLSDVSRIIVPESGQGALGPVLLPLLNIYPDYRNHPTFFRKMERFIKALLGVDLTYEQPRLWHTKGQTIAAFLARPGIKPEQVIETRSCWQRRFNVCVAGKMRQCGVCAACLLRRMSLHAAGIDEPADSYVFSNLSAEHFSDARPKSKQVQQSSTLLEYSIAGTRHLQQLADMAERPDEKLCADADDLARATGTTREDTLKNLKTLLATHAQEWRAFIGAQGEKSFLRSWM